MHVAAVYFADCTLLAAHVSLWLPGSSWQISQLVWWIISRDYGSNMPYLWRKLDLKLTFYFTKNTWILNVIISATKTHFFMLVNFSFYVRCLARIWISTDVVKVKIASSKKIIHNHPNKVFNTFCCYGKQRASWSIKFIPGLFAFMQGRDLYICLDFGVIWLVLWETYTLAGWNCFEVFINAVSHSPTS